MGEILDYRLFRFGGTPITVGSLAAAILVFAGSWILARLVRKIVAERFLAQRLAVGVRYAIARFLSYLILVLGALGTNIFCVAVSRWPWQRRHIPFLLAHLGILMLLAGWGLWREHEVSVHQAHPTLA